MSKALTTIGKVAGAVALVASGVGAIGGIALATKIGAIAGIVGTPSARGCKVRMRPDA
jgi:hypothetical protein